MPAPLAPGPAPTEMDPCTTTEDDSPVKSVAADLQADSVGMGSLQPPAPSPSTAHPQLDALLVASRPPVALGPLAAVAEVRPPMPAPASPFRASTEPDWCNTTNDESSIDSVAARDAYGSRPQDCGEACCCLGRCLMGEFCCSGRRSCDRDGRQRHSPHYCNICDPDLLEHC